MKKIAFSEAIDNEVEVTVNGDSYGVIKFDAGQNAWVLWPVSIDDGVSYFEDLEETEETIKDEIIAFDKGY